MSQSRRLSVAGIGHVGASQRVPRLCLREGGGAGAREEGLRGAHW